MIKLVLHLPRDRETVPLARRVLDGALSTAGVAPECRADINLALTEACANVVSHASDVAEYEVAITAEGQRCTIEVTDTGPGAEPAQLTQPMPDPRAESGRGLHIIRAVMDVAEVAAGPAGGLVIRMIKKLVFTPGPTLA
ncbi:MAG TPA: ATP-binding protein [Pilimelia sp.]|nr:ATP-binding protein [Pilimelia sp.]